ncbi:hypothetical protein HanIR_Chr10g0500031 [Helianthus annuus]|nr:hypothetical protein HanIR_Chr10g0500031 [Helianthus annuus]
MLWIGMYLALASLVCILFMVADLLHGLRSRMLSFPSEYFTINSASLTVISVAMKLPVDLSGFPCRVMWTKWQSSEAWPLCVP